jgi:hypothetical protein
LTWTRQIKQYGIDVPYITLEGSSDEKWKQLDRFGDGLIIIHYPGAAAMCSRARKKRKAGRKLEISPTMLSRFAKRVDAVVFDESTRLGHRASLTSQLGRMLAKRVGIRYNLAGRPFGRDPTLVWQQQKLIDGGASFGPTLGLFQAAFCSEEENDFAGEYARDYKFKKQMMPQFTRLLQHRSITYAEGECLDLPPYEAIIEEISLPSEAAAYYRNIVRGVRQAAGNFRELKGIFIRMRQLSSGFVGFKDDETGERAQIEFTVNPKLDRLLELVDELPQGRKLVVFYEFTWSGRRIVEALGRLGIGCIWLWSGTKDSDGSQERFMCDPGCEIAVINSRVGAYSIDGLQDVANYVCFYESPVSCLDREQAEKRLRRQGQRRCVFQYDLVVRGTKDQLILDYHKEGRDLFAELRRDAGILM